MTPARLVSHAAFHHMFLSRGKLKEIDTDNGTPNDRCSVLKVIRPWQL